MEASSTTQSATLRDGSEILIRPLRPEDRESVATGFERLGELSRYRRFMTPKPRLTSSELSYLTDVDHHFHEALVAFAPDTREPLGVARFVRFVDEPDVAEPAVAVVDDWHGRGVGTVLLDALSRRAREEGISRFRATVLKENRPMLSLLEKSGPLTVRHGSGAEAEVEFQLEPGSRWRQLLDALRAAARGELQFALPRPRPDAGDQGRGTSPG
jgi:RimJ/RimL family protein N-acetyltransferase